MGGCMVPPKTIFAFLMLNTMSPAHEEIFGAKFLSFERLGYITNTQSVMRFTGKVRKQAGCKSGTFRV